MLRLNASHIEKANTPAELIKAMVGALVRMTAFDLVAADWVYQKALENKIGIDVNFKTRGNP
jgi:hypothetical protein